MKLDRVTMTGADDSVDHDDLADLSEEFPFVEWGLLFSTSAAGSARFPSPGWLMGLARAPRMQLSFHICGRWVREICAGYWTPLCTAIGPSLDLGRRVQLNFHSYEHLLAPGFVEAAKERCHAHDWQMIFQCDEVNDCLMSNAYDDGLNVVPLYDKSGGGGRLPETWPKAMAGIYSGYAGGLGPDNLETELQAISEAANGGRFWVDMETKIRTPDDRVFDLTAVRQCLEICAPHVVTKAKELEG